MKTPMQQLLLDLADVLERHDAVIETGYDNDVWVKCGGQTEPLPIEATDDALRDLVRALHERDRRWALEVLGDFFRSLGELPR
jgi:hypothetical protein